MQDTKLLKNYSIVYKVPGRQLKFVIDIVDGGLEVGFSKMIFY